MLRGLWKLTWIELKIFLREPLGAIGTIVIPVLVFILVGRAVSPKLGPTATAANTFIGVGLPWSSPRLRIAISAVLSLVTIISIYREGGILKRLCATPLGRPQTILTAHVIAVKLLLTAATLSLMVLAGKRYYPVGIHVPFVGFTIALLISTVQHLVDWLSYRQHRAHGAVCAADRCHHHVSDDRRFRTLRADCVACHPCCTPRR